MFVLRNIGGRCVWFLQKIARPEKAIRPRQISRLLSFLNMSHTFFPAPIIPSRSPFLPPDARLHLELRPTPVIFSESRYHSPYNVLTSLGTALRPIFFHHHQRAPQVISAHKTLVCCATNFNPVIPSLPQNVPRRPSNFCTTTRATKQDWVSTL
jgi:hypothetical protein